MRLPLKEQTKTLLAVEFIGGIIVLIHLNLFVCNKNQRIILFSTGLRNLLLFYY